MRGIWCQLIQSLKVAGISKSMDGTEDDHLWECEDELVRFVDDLSVVESNEESRT